MVAALMKYLLNSPAPLVSLNGTERGHVLYTKKHTHTHVHSGFN